MIFIMVKKLINNDWNIKIKNNKNLNLNFLHSDKSACIFKDEFYYLI